MKNIVNSLKRVVLLLLMLGFAFEVEAADYIFGCEINSVPYLCGLKDSATSASTLYYWSDYSETTRARCTWHCVDSVGKAVQLSTSKDRYLYIEENGVKYYLRKAQGDGPVEYVANPDLKSGSYTWKVISSGGYYYLIEGSSKTNRLLYFNEEKKEWHTSGTKAVYTGRVAKIGSCVTARVNNTKHGKVMIYNKATSTPVIDQDVASAYSVSENKYYLYAKENSGYSFKGWSSDNSASIISTTMTGYEYKHSSTTQLAGSLVDRYAMYAPYWLFDAKGVAKPSDGGTVAVSCESRIEGRIASTLTTTKTTATFTATPGSDYGFKGWAKDPASTEPDKDEKGNLMVSNPITRTITNTVPGQTATETLYALFYQLPEPTSFTVSPNPMVLVKSVTDQITLSFVPSPCFQDVTYASADEKVATVNVSGLVTGIGQGTTTITVTAKKRDGTDAFSQTVTVQVVDTMSAPVLKVEPSKDDNYYKALVTITAGPGSPTATILRYTTDGTDPTATSAVYSEPFKIGNQQTVKARAYCTEWYESAVVEQKYEKSMTAPPTIKMEQSGSDYVVSFTCVDADVVFYYTTDGTTPTSASTKWDGTPFTPGMTDGTITVIATHDGWSDSEPVSKNYVRTSGVSGGVVYLNDYEDHTWTYYTGVDTKVDDGNYNTNYKNIMYSPNPRNVKITYQGNGGAVSIDNPDTSFVYYNTIEQDAESGKWLYTTIANPFSKRPTVGTGNDRWRGFGSWRVVSVSGGDIKSSDGGITYAEGGEIPAETEIQFVPSGTYTPNCTSMEIVLAANWVQAYRYMTSKEDLKGSSYETNFIVITSKAMDVSSISKPFTVMAVEPDGSADYRSTGKCKAIKALRDGIVKMEYITYSSNLINAAGKYLYIGRGVTMTNETKPALYGSYSIDTTSIINAVLKVESGTFQTFTCYNKIVTGSNIQKMVVVLGSDYDRATGNNNNLEITGQCQMLESAITKETDGDIFKVYIKSGKINSQVEHKTAQASTNCFYMWENGGGGLGTRSLEIQGGELWHICGGADDANYKDNRITLSYRMKGGTVHGCFYGGAAQYASYGSKKFVFTGGTVEGWISGGSDAYLSEEKKGIVNGQSYIYIGGNLKVDSHGSTTPVDAGMGGTVFGAGIGQSSKLDGTVGKVKEGTNIVVADNSYVERGVYGGGSYGYTDKTSYMYITGGHIAGKNGGVNDTIYTADVKGGIYGGACKNKGGDVKVYMTGGTIEGGIYGGSNVNGVVKSVNMVIAGGQVGTASNLSALACGGGYGSNTGVSGNVAMTLGVAGTTTSPYFYGNCYGGSALGSVTGNVNMTINKGGSYALGSGTGGEIYCGGLGESGNLSYGIVKGSLTTVINGTDARPSADTYAYNAVYGGSHYINLDKIPTVTVNGCEVSIKELYGGSKQAALSGTNITVNGGNTIGSLFGGSNQADISGNVTLNVYGGGIDRVFGGNNNSGVISGAITMNIDQQSSCAMRLGEVYGGGNLAASNSVTINLECPGYIGQLYGGANQADITGDINLNVHGGTCGTIYGGNNKSGTVSGSVTVTANKTGTCDLDIGTIFGGGNLADLALPANTVTVNVAGDGTKVGNIYGGGNEASVYSTTVNIEGGQVSGNIFGGGKGKTGWAKKMILSGGTNVNITGGTLTNVFGGNDLGGTIIGELKTIINKNTDLDITGEVYGGGNEAPSEAGKLTITCADHIGTVYGGAKNADITGDVTLLLAGGKIDNVFGGNNLGGIISGNISVQVYHEGCSPVDIGTLYGGGNLADYTAPTESDGGKWPKIEIIRCKQTTKDWENAGLHCVKVGTIFGGGKGVSAPDDYRGKVIGHPQVNVYAGEIGTIFGGGNAADVEGNPSINIHIDATKVKSNAEDDIFITGNVYGGGNEANVIGTPEVKVQN